MKVEIDTNYIAHCLAAGLEIIAEEYGYSEVAHGFEEACATLALVLEAEYSGFDRAEFIKLCGFDS
jgi:hypothetical protein